MEQKATSTSPTVGERKPLFYRNPMNPAITSPVPAKDEMGMDYIPVYPEDLQGGTSTTPGTVVIDPVTMQKMGVRTQKVSMKELSKEITTYGIVSTDEDGLFMVHAKFNGWVEDIKVKRTGDWVKKGEVLLYVYSPEIVTAEAEFIMALRNLSAVSEGSKEVIKDAKALLMASKKRLELFGLPDWFIEDLKKTKITKKVVPIEAPADGIVTKIRVRPKSFITPKTILYEIADLRTVWVLASFFEEELPWIKVGNRALIEIKGINKGKFEGKIDYIYPVVDKKTRTVNARIILKNPDLTIRPGMYATVTVHSAAHGEVLVIPKEAVLRTGKHEHVFVMREPGKFEPRAVSLGLEANDLVEVLKGLSHGEEVVVSGQFLIDSESSLKEAALKMMEPTANKKAGNMKMHHHMKNHASNMKD
ncbi:efflux RND transporter periplasmic adaptor subunit [Dissulfuribacter thermophilus]|uniref:efflux RND transporter periplasmic adaptor subunit n=1 Tax=Dissulfuribacter thermophilus TaxID=1156395 RepID=UPI00137AD090|nr:efflux RND transporter periplasmic adaptor subunit [Dissulfuribacter thermophilus]